MGSNPSNCKGAKNPVEMVSWNDCQNFVAKLKDKVPGQAVRLPTEAEWEYACRAGSTGDYCYGDGEGDLPEYAWYRANANSGTHPAAKRNRMRAAFTTCTATFGNGVRMSITQTTKGHRPTAVHGHRAVWQTACCGAGRGTIMRPTSARRSATGTPPAAGAPFLRGPGGGGGGGGDSVIRFRV